MHHGITELVRQAYEEPDRYIFPEFLDFSSFTNYLACPRLWFFNQIMGMVPEYPLPNVHLVFGKIWHRALEAGYLYILHNGLPKSRDFLVELCIGELDVAWVDLDAEEVCEPPKTYQKARSALETYWTQMWPLLQETEILSVEQPFALPLGPGYPVLFGTIDLVSREPRGITVGEHKTTGSFAQKWQEGWANSWQCEAYASAIYTMYEELPRIVVTGTLFQKTHPPDVKRIPFTKSREQLDRFHAELRWKLDGFLDDLDQLTYEAAHGMVQSAFPRNAHNCQSYRLCAYYDWCCDDVRPYLTERPMAGMQWLPRDGSGIFAKVTKT